MKAFNEIQQKVAQSPHEVLETGVKGGVGAVGSFAAMSINDWAGLIVAVLTGIYMLLQILEILRKK